MEKTLPLYLGSSVIGSVICRQDERHLTLCARTYASLQGICRAYVKGADGNLLIGVLAPDHASFSAQRSITKTALADTGLSFDSITYAYAICSTKKSSPDTTDWQKLERIPEILCKNNVVSALAKSTDALCDSNFSPTRIAVPLITGRPFPRPDVLCLLTPREINGTMYGVLGISKSGAPRKV